MAQKKQCELCNGDMIKISSVMVGDTVYAIWKCQKCHHEVASAED